MAEQRAPHRILVGQVAYERAPHLTAPVAPARLGSDAEGRAIYGDLARANSRKIVFLASEDPPLVGYVRPDPPAGLSLADVVGLAFSEPLPRPEALGVLGILAAKHVVLIDGTRLGGARDVLAEAVAGAALEPDGFAVQASRVPDWALVEAVRPRWDALAARLLRVRWVRELADPDFGFVRAIAPRGLTLNKTSRDAVDIGQRLVVRSQDNSHGAVVVRVTEVGDRVVQAVQRERDSDQGLAHGDPVDFLPNARASEHDRGPTMERTS